MIQENQKIVDIVIIGAGPGGVASAIEAKLAGIDNIIVIEKAEMHNDVVTDQGSIALAFNHAHFAINNIISKMK